MRRVRCRCLTLLALPLLWVTSLAHAGVQLVVDGVGDNLKTAVSAGVELSQYARRKISDAQVRRLYDRAPAQAQSALRPYGYYDATVTGELQQLGPDDWRVTLHVQPGAPVLVTAVELQLAPVADAIKPIQRARRAIEHLKGQPLNDGAYEAVRDALSAQLTANGFLDAKLLTHRVEVTRASHSAVIKLAWQTGPRYRFGKVNFVGSPFRPGFLARYVPFKSGSYFAQDELLALQRALNGADYFSVVNVQPDVGDAQHGVVDVTVQLVPAKRTVYTGGPFIGTDTGVGLQGGIERRWVNRRGHKWKNALVLAQRLKTLSTQYTIPLPGPDQRSLDFGANLRHATTTTSQSRTLELVADETRLWHGWQRTLGAHALSGTFTVGQHANEPDNAPGIDHGNSTLVFAAAALTRKQADNASFVQHGWSLTLAARSTVGALLSNTRFSQLTADAKWIHGFAGNNRLILRGDAGTTWAGNFDALPPQLRFFAGGASSVRGYGYQALGPKNSYGRVIGGRHLLVASSEVEHYFSRQWGIAAFVDAGNAFNGTDYRPRLGAGLGVRWRSPVGMVRVDLGTPIHNPDAHGIELHLVIGPDL